MPNAKRLTSERELPGALWSLFHTHLPRLPTQRRIVVTFSYTFGPLPHAAAHCGHFFIHIRPLTHKAAHCGHFFIHICPGYPCCGALSRCGRFSIHIRLISPYSCKLWSLFRTHLPRLPMLRSIVVTFSCEILENVRQAATIPARQTSVFRSHDRFAAYQAVLLPFALR